MVSSGESLDNARKRWLQLSTSLFTHKAPSSDCHSPSQQIAMDEASFMSNSLVFILETSDFAGDFQGPALVVILEGAYLSRDEVAGLQFLPPWGLRGDTINYGLGLLSCFSISDFVSVVSDGFLYMFDPKGLALAMPSHRGPAAKMFSLRGIDEQDSWLCLGTNLTERFRDQFSPLLIDQNVPWSLSNSTVIRMPFSLECMKDGSEFGLKKISVMLDKFLNNASATILFLKSVLQVMLLHFEVGFVVP
uniref:Sacsin/Nov domain-containing protein n=1 Tax=Solanum lycopersicum TaxID=4081 RepID=A0A3Q7EVM1_SOLLC